nr:integumentary mucin C.1-like [Bactrocera oleae]
MCVNTIMLSSLKSTALLLLLLLIATVFSLGAAKNLRYKHEITTIATEAETLQPTTTTPKPPTTVKTTTTTTTKLLQSRPPSQQNIVDCGKSDKIVFPTNDDSEEDSKFDVYGLKTTPPPPKQNEVKLVNIMTPTESTIITTTKSTTEASDSVSNSTVKSFDNRVGVLNLPPHCPKGFVVVNQYCHQPA